jgi:superfamily II DNA or RNA helicase
MPTGTGKTLVGLTIASYKQQKDNLKVVFLCPNNQLAVI